MIRLKGFGPPAWLLPAGLGLLMLLATAGAESGDEQAVNVLAGSSGEAVEAVGSLDAAGLAAIGVEAPAESAGPADGPRPVYKLRPEPYGDSDAEEIGLDELLELALACNFGLQGEHYSIEKSHYSVDQTYYAFDPSVSADLSAVLRRGSGPDSESYSAGFGYTIPREYGDSFSLSYDLSRSDGGLAGTGDYSSSTGVTYNRPLGRGAGRFLNLIPRFLASNNLQLSYDRLDDQLRQLKKRVLDAYFNALAAREAISVREASLDVALKQLDRSVERYKAGLGIQADVLQSENAVLTQKSSLLSARKQYESALDALTELTGLPREFKLKPGGQELLEGYGAQLPADLWDLVMCNSFDLKSLNTQLASQRLAREQALNGLKRDIGLGVSYTRGGSDDKLGGALTGGDNQTVGVQLSYSGKPGERAAKASLASSELDLASLDLSIQETELALKTDLREKQRSLEERAEQVALAESNLAVVRQTYDIQVERNKVGLETTLNVVEAQEAVLSAELGLLQAKVAYHQAYRELLLLAGLI